MTSQPAPSAPDRVQRVRMRSPGEIVSAIPFLLGFVPDESLVLISLRGRRLGMTCRLDLDDVEPDALEMLVGAVQRDNGTAVILAAFATDRSVTATTLSRVRGAMAGARLPVAEEVSVVGGRWFHEACPDSRCCPPEGTPVADHDQAPSTLALGAATGGYRVDREDLAAQCLPHRPLLTQAIRAELDHPALAEDAQPETAVEDIAAVLGWRGPDEATPVQYARAALRARHPGVRDVWYALVAPGMMLDHRTELVEPLHQSLAAIGAAAGDLSEDGILLDSEARNRILARLIAWVRDLPDDEPDVCMFPFVIAAMAHWCAGDGALARVLVERASALDAPRPGMLETLQMSLMHGVRPAELGWLAPQIAHHRRQQRRRERIEGARMRRRRRRGRDGRAA